ncbi:helix-turn-helix domain-containing protein [Desulfolucanica intricata]|uniref:helix-turn-helix domain-containing protein n=1 Tax=Desulfolucanica intricata TaxID=1285191 RepID=UPI001EE4D870|nr:helix-turn-helix domain-containing protein [Desulfolucanica intricata]
MIELEDKLLKYCLENILSLTEASQRWGLSEATIRMGIHRDRFIEGEEIRKSGKIWLITYQAMERVYGKEPKKNEDV